VGGKSFFVNFAEIFHFKPKRNETEESVDGCADVVQHDSNGGTNADAADSH
jgi:hypothetical protein